MNILFEEEGLLLIDAAYTPLRKLESEYFQVMIKNSAELARLVFEKEAEYAGNGYGTPIQAKESAANLFFVEDGERFLLERQDHLFVHEAQGNLIYRRRDVRNCQKSS